MDYKKINNQYILRIDKDKEILETLLNFCIKENIKAGFITGIGAIKKVILGFFEPFKKQYHTKEYSDSYEVVSLSGNISRKDNKPHLHCHIVLSDKNFDTFAGHLSEAWVSTTFEVIIITMEGNIKRQYSEEIGLNLLNFRAKL